MTAKTNNADDSATESNAPAHNTGQHIEQITLGTPIKRGDTSVTTITLRKPRAGQLRGIKLTDLMQMDVAATAQVLPRISDPVLTEQEINAMDPADFVQISAGVAGFLVPKQHEPDDAT